MSMDVEAMMRATLDQQGFRGLPQVDPWAAKYQEEDKPALPMLPAPKAVERDVLHVASNDAASYVDKRITLQRIMKAVCEATGVRMVDFLGQGRTVSFVRARHIYYWAAKTYTGKSFPYIGRSCGGRDHSTVIHGVNKVNSRMPEYADTIAKVMALLRVNASSDLT